MSRTRDNEIELESFDQKQERKRKAAQNHGISAGVTVVDGAGLTAVYTTFLHPILKTFMEELGKFFLFPILALASVVQAILAWRQASLEKWKSRTIVHAVVETVAAAAIVTAVVGALALSTTFAMATPLIFVAVGAVKAIYNGSAAIYNSVKESHATTEKSRQKYHARAVNHGVAAAANLTGAVISAVVFVLGKIAVAVAGVFFGLAVVGLGIFHGVKAYQAQKAAKDEASKPILEDDQREDPQPGLQNNHIQSLTLGKSDTASIRGALHRSQGSGTQTMTRQDEVTILTAADNAATSTKDKLTDGEQEILQTPKKLVADTINQENRQQDERSGYAMGFY